MLRTSTKFRRPPFKVSPYAVLIIGVVTVSIAGPLIRAALRAGAPALVIATLRLVVASLALSVPAMLRTRGEFSKLSRSDILLAILSGLLLAAHFGTWIASFTYTSVMSSVVLVTTTPIWIGLASPLLLGERNSIRTWVGIVIALLGSLLIAFVDARSVATALRGDLLALTGAILGAGYWLIGRGLRRKLSLLAYIWIVYGTAAIAMLLWTGGQILLFDYAINAISPIALVWIGLLALLPQLVGHTAINHGMRHIKATVVSLTVLGEPIGSSILAALLFQEIPGIVQILGAVLILSGIAVGAGEQDTIEDGKDKIDTTSSTVSD